MNLHSPVLSGFLAIVFALHILAFGFLAYKRKTRKHTLLTGTFIALCILYTLKFVELSPAIPLGSYSLPLAYLLRASALVTTFLAFFWKQPAA